MGRRIVAWVDQGENDEPVYKWCTIAQAVKTQKEIASALHFTYQSDHLALMDFVTVHWGAIYESTHAIDESDYTEELPNPSP